MSLAEGAIFQQKGFSKLFCVFILLRKEQHGQGSRANERDPSEGWFRAREGKTLTKRQAGPNEAEHVSHVKEPECHPKHKVKNHEQFFSLWVVWRCEDTKEEVETTS